LSVAFSILATTFVAPRVSMVLSRTMHAPTPNTTTPNEMLIFQIRSNIQA